MRIRFHFIQYTCAFLLFFALSTHAALKTDTWTGGTGIWNNASNWSLHVVPHNNNGSNDQYVVNIDGGNSTAAAVVVDPSLNPTVNAVVLDANDSLLITNGVTLTLTNSATFNGTVTLASANSGATLQFNGTTTMGGTGKVIYGGISPVNDRVYAPSGALTIGPGLTIRGAGGQLLGSPSGPVINQGTICNDANNQTMNLSYVVNQGQIIASNGAALSLNNFTNTGTVSINGATLTLTSPWSNSGVISDNVGVVNLGGTFTAAGGTFVNVGGTTLLTGTLINTNSTLALTASTGSWTFNGGTIQGGAITATGGGQLLMPPNGIGTLNGVTLNADLTLSNNAEIFVLNGLTENAVLTLASTGNGTWLLFTGAQTLAGNGEILMAGTVPSRDALFASGTLTVGAGITIHGAGSINGDQGNPFVNLGTISADASNQQLLASFLMNQGQLLATNGATLTLNSFTNSGTISVFNGSTVQLENNWNNSGTINATGGTLTLAGPWSNSGVISDNVSVVNLGGIFTMAGGSFVNVGGTVTVNGTLVNTNSTLALTATTGSWYLNGGTIQGGTITASDGTQLFLPPNGVGTLDAVTLDANLTLSNNAEVFVLNGLTNNAVLTLASTGLGTWLLFTGTQTLAGNGEILLSGANPAHDALFASGTLTVGSSIIIDGAGAINGDQNNPLVNQGTISANTSNQQLMVSYFINQGQMLATNGATLSLSSFTNSGTISALNGSTIQLENSWNNSGMVSATGGTLTLAGLWSNSGVISDNVSVVNLGGTFTMAGGSFVNLGGTTLLTGTLINTNGTLALTASTGSWTFNGGAIQGGAITTTDGTQLLMPPNGAGTLDAVTLDANLTLSNNAEVFVLNGLTNNAVLTLASTGNGTWLLFTGTQTLAGNGEILMAGTSPAHDALFASGTLTVGAGITIHGAGSINGDQGNPLVNQGTISADASNQQLLASYFINQGQMLATNGATLSLSNFTNSGTISIGNASTLQFIGDYVQAGGSTVLNGGQITPITGGSILLEGGRLCGSGFINAVVTNSGSIVLGPASGPLVFFSNLVLNASSVLNFQFDGATVSQPGYAVLGNGVNLAGSLAVTLINGFVPEPGSSFTVLTSGAPITGGFNNVVSGFRIQTTDGAGSFVYIQNSSSITLANFQADSQPYLTWALSYFGCTNCPQSSEIADPDGDGINNFNEFMWGTDPTNSALTVSITSIVRSTNDITITWQTVGGHTNMLQAANGDGSGNMPTNFVDLPPQIVVSGAGASITNQVDVGGATNGPARFYRIRLVP